jgi:hypothetical protein
MLSLLIMTEEGRLVSENQILILVMNRLIRVPHVVCLNQHRPRIFQSDHYARNRHKFGLLSQRLI